MSAEELLDKVMHGEVVMVKGHTLLTGTQWYDRFEKELPPDNYHRDYVLEVAKRAAGLDK